MPEYRFYLLDANDRITSATAHVCPDDDAAKQHARKLLAEDGLVPAVEVWNLGRQVAVVRRD
jgi:hypothetical protein